MKHTCRCVIILFAGLTTVPARCDGGRVQMHERAGPFVVTLLSVPDNLVTGPADLSVGVEDAATGEVIDGAEVRLSLSPLDNRAASPIVATATHRSSTRGILQAAQVSFPRAGRWHVDLVVTHQGMTGLCATDLSVGTAHQRAYEVWVAGLTPFLLVLGFIVHQSRKRRMKIERTKRVELPEIST